MAQTDMHTALSLSLSAENRAETKEQSVLRSALSSASCRRSGRSPALPYPPHEQFQSTMLFIHPSKRGHFYFVKKGTFLLCIDRAFPLSLYGRGAGGEGCPPHATSRLIIAALITISTALIPTSTARLGQISARPQPFSITSRSALLA